jgi:hypothetical protein
LAKENILYGIFSIAEKDYTIVERNMLAFHQFYAGHNYEEIKLKFQSFD